MVFIKIIHILPGNNIDFTVPVLVKLFEMLEFFNLIRIYFREIFSEQFHLLGLR
jgi:hypothetical protein